MERGKINEFLLKCFTCCTAFRWIKFVGIQKIHSNISNEKCVCDFLTCKMFKYFFVKETTFSNYSDIYQSIYYPLNPNEWTVMWRDFRWWEYLHVDPFVWQLTSGCFTRYICFCKTSRDTRVCVFFSKYTKKEWKSLRNKI